MCKCRLIREKGSETTVEIPESLVILPNRVAVSNDHVFLVVYDNEVRGQKLICLSRNVDPKEGILWEAEPFPDGATISAPLVIRERCVLGDSGGRVYLFQGKGGPFPTGKTSEGREAGLGYNVRVDPIGIDTKAYFLSEDLDGGRDRIIYKVNVADSMFPIPFARLGGCSPVAVCYAKRFWFVQLSDGYCHLDPGGGLIGRTSGGAMVGVRDDVPPTIIGPYIFTMTSSGRVHTTVYTGGKCFTRPYFPEGLQHGGAFTSLVPGDGALFGAREDGLICKIVIDG
ncbi:MAG: hypothetical protein ABIK65_14755 [Candidatus Eisenbacteria bacterium]